ncbi:hypothetical protein SRHO_G00217150 [Serrasalmus rhombeus]
MVSTNEPSTIWKCLQNITSYKRTPLQTMGDRQMADELNTFYCRFEKPSSKNLSSTDLHPPVFQPSIEPALKICKKKICIDSSGDKKLIETADGVLYPPRLKQQAVIVHSTRGTGVSERRRTEYISIISAVPVCLLRPRVAQRLPWPDPISVKGNLILSASFLITA